MSSLTQANTLAENHGITEGTIISKEDPTFYVVTFSLACPPALKRKSHLGIPFLGIARPQS
jgi:hypothetical protein